MGLQGVGSRLAGGCDVRVSVGSRSGICSYTDNGDSFRTVKDYAYFSLPSYMKAHEETRSKT
jgi:hypothetical protein